MRVAACRYRRCRPRPSVARPPTRAGECHDNTGPWLPRGARHGRCCDNRSIPLKRNRWRERLKCAAPRPGGARTSRRGQGSRRRSGTAARPARTAALANPARARPEGRDGCSRPRSAPRDAAAPAPSAAAARPANSLHQNTLLLDGYHRRQCWMSCSGTPAPGQKWHDQRRQRWQGRRRPRLRELAQQPDGRGQGRRIRCICSADQRIGRQIDRWAHVNSRVDGLAAPPAVAKKKKARL